MLFDENINIFEKRISEIINYIEYINSQKKILGLIDSIEHGTDEKLQMLLKYKKNLEEIVNSNIQYSAIIISLYGLFESFIEDIFKTYLNKIYSLLNYDYNKLPAKILNKHKIKTGEFLSNSNRFKNYEIDVENVISNLYNCINRNSKAKLNEEFILSHSSNIGIEELLNFMNDFNILDGYNSIINSEKFIKYISSKIEKEEIEKVKEYIKGNKNKKELLFYELDLLLKERNKIAHSWIVDTRISLTVIIEEIIPFIKCLSNIIRDILLDNYCGLLKENNKLKCFAPPLDVYNNIILCINNKNALLKKDDFIFREKKGKIEPIKIIELQKNGIILERINEKNIDIGIKVNKKIKKTDKFYYK